MSFPIRKSFHYPLQTPSWYLGHMAKSMKDMAHLLKDISLVIEARDSRMPLSSINPAFDSLLDKVWGPGYGGTSDAGEAGPSGGLGVESSLKGKEREKVVVYTKRDMAEGQYEQPLKTALKRHLGQRVFFTDTRVDADVKTILRHAVRLAKENQEFITQMNILVVGMPNVGKSSLLNALRRVGVHKGKAFRTGNLAGVTRKLTGTVKIYEDPPIYVYDTPGVMVPFLGHGDGGAERGFKFALSAGIKEDLLETEVAVDYLLWRLNQRYIEDLAKPESSRRPTYIEALKLGNHLPEPTDDIHTFLDAVCNHIGALKKGGERDQPVGIAFVIQAFRDGKFGRWTMDELVPTEEYLARREVRAQERALEEIDTNVEPGPQPSSPTEDHGVKSRDAVESEVSDDLDMTDSPETVPAPTSGSKSDPPTTPKPESQTLSLNKSVSLAVREYLDTVAFAQTEHAQGRGLSPTQQKKAVVKARVEERMAKARARKKEKGGAAKGVQRGGKTRR